MAASLDQSFELSGGNTSFDSVDGITAAPVAAPSRLAITTAADISFDVINDNDAEETDHVSMVRGVPQRRTFDSGYGEGTSRMSSPTAEPRSATLNAQSSRESYGNARSSRNRLRRQKAVDNTSCPNSAGKSRTCVSVARVNNSSTDYEENEDYDEVVNRIGSIRPRSHRGISGGQVMKSSKIVKAYGRLRRKTSFTSDSSDQSGAGDENDEVDDDECNTASSGTASSSSSDTGSHHHHDHRKVVQKLKRYHAKLHSVDDDGKNVCALPKLAFPSPLEETTHLSDVHESLSPVPVVIS